MRHARTISKQIKIAQALDSTELYSFAKELRVPHDLLKKTAELGRLPVVNFAAGGLGRSSNLQILDVRVGLQILDVHVGLQNLDVHVCLQTFHLRVDQTGL